MAEFKLPDVGEGLTGTFDRLLVRAWHVRLDDFDDLRASGQDWIECERRFLEDEPDACAADRHEVVVAHSAQFLAIK